MLEMKRQTSHWWWFDSHKNARRSPWLQSTLAELDEKTKAMLKLVEEDADSFAQRAEMYYKKRPELISMVEEFYRAHRSLAEQYDQVKSGYGTRLLKTSPFSFTSNRPGKFMSAMDQTYDSFSEISDPEECAESEVEDPEQEDNTQVDKETKEVVSGEIYNDESEMEDPEQEEETQVDKARKEEKVSIGVSNDAVMNLRVELEKLRKENMIQKDQLLQKDEEKREVIRQLSSSIDVLMEENMNLRKCFARGSPNKKGPFEFNKLKETFLKKVFNGS